MRNAAVENIAGSDSIDGLDGERLDEPFACCGCNRRTLGAKLDDCDWGAGGAKFARCTQAIIAARRHPTKDCRGLTLVRRHNIYGAENIAHELLWGCRRRVENDRSTRVA